MATEIGVEEFNIPEPDQVALVVEHVQLFRDAEPFEGDSTLYITKEYADCCIRPVFKLLMMCAN